MILPVAELWPPYQYLGPPFRGALHTQVSQIIVPGLPVLRLGQDFMGLPWCWAEWLLQSTFNALT